MKKLSQKEVLRYQPGRRSPGTVRSHYLDWRAEQTPPIPLRCDNELCKYNTEPLVWNGASLAMVLDHINGVCGDNSPQNLRFLCPNCNAQLETHGGGNKGRVEQSRGGFAQISKDGKRHHTLPAEPGSYTIRGHEVSLTKS